MSQASEQWKWSEMQDIELLSYSPTITPTATLELERGESKKQMELEGESSLPDNKRCDFFDGNEKIKNVAFVGFDELFRFVDGLDYILMTVGTLGAIVHGCSLPLFLRFFADLVNSFGSNADDLDKITQEVVKYAFYFLIVGAAIWASSWAKISCWMWTGEIQSTRMRIKYLEAALDQDTRFFDTEVRTSDVVFSINSDAVMVQDVIIGCSAVWQLALVTLAVVPMIAVIGGIHTTTLAKLSGKSQEDLSQDGNIVEQTVVQIRVVLAYVGETKALQVYSSTLRVAQKIGYRTGLAKGIGLGATYFVVFYCYALLLWYGGYLVRHH
ncbi:Multidrug resistance protein 1 [Lathyrus oleraceus]|uniref:Multidrug resistance protein 1 n=1 Tax=Pisum sativum TaxID=3888 RepID=A0A9D4Y7Q8_PEA|nr:Multidrug resistance protein 1 [Pisum sativum]